MLINGEPTAPEGYTRPDPVPLSVSKTPASSARKGATLSRGWALVALADARLRASWLARLALLSSFSLTVGYGGAMLLVGRGEGSQVVDVLAIHAVGWATWLCGGLVALAAARDFAALDLREGISGLSSQRGYDAQALEHARTLAATHRVLRVMAPPVVVLGVLNMALVTSLGSLPVRLLQLAALCLYACVVAAVLGPLARWSARLSPNHGRAILLVILLGPELAGVVWSAVPSIPGLLDWFLVRLIELGAT